MLRSRRRCAQTAHISLQQFNFSKSADTKQPDNPNFGLICRLASRYSLQRFTATSSSAEPAFPRHVCFGEAVFRPGNPNPQEEKTHHVTISCQAQEKKGFSHPCRLGDAAVACNLVLKWPGLPLFQAKSGAEWVIRPPAMVKAIPICPRSPGATASISPSSSTRSAASPGTSRPVSPSICAAQAPPAV
jgi:hypothetical protein